MSKQEGEYYWAVERQKVLLMWLCLFCKIVCIAPALGESAANSMWMAQGRGRACAPSISPSSAGTHTWPRSLLDVLGWILFALNLDSLCMLKHCTNFHLLSNVLDSVYKPLDFWHHRTLAFLFSFTQGTWTELLAFLSQVCMEQEEIWEG